MTSPQPPEVPANSDPDSAVAAQPPAAEQRGGGGSPGAAPAPPTPEEQLAAAKQEAAANYDRYLRAVADLENYRRRMAREKDDLRHSVTANLLQHLLPVIDNLQLAVAAGRQDAAAGKVADGVTMVLDQFRGALERHGVRALDPLGQKFDPHQHESIAHQPSATVPEEHVLQVVRVGYMLHGRLVRPASVVLSSGPAREGQG
jgi:molecular chaperone GrpE